MRTHLIGAGAIVLIAAFQIVFTSCQDRGPSRLFVLATAKGSGELEPCG
jgi:hypothetical protein